jgi:hypothetical protein
LVGVNYWSPHLRYRRDIVFHRLWNLPFSQEIDIPHNVAFSGVIIGLKQVLLSFEYRVLSYLFLQPSLPPI